MIENDVEFPQAAGNLSSQRRPHPMVKILVIYMAGIATGVWMSLGKVL